MKMPIAYCQGRGPVERDPAAEGQPQEQMRRRYRCNAEKSHREADTEFGSVQELDQQCSQVERSCWLTHSRRSEWPDPTFFQDAKTLDSHPGLVAMKAGRNLFQTVHSQESRNGCQYDDCDQLPPVA